jgi:diacylglycerol kinase family enzyme
MSRRRLAAAIALAAALATVALAAYVALVAFPRGLALVGCALLALAAAWYGLLRRGLARVAGMVVAAIALAAVLFGIAGGGHLAESLLVVAGAVLALFSARAAFAVHVPLPAAPAPNRPVVFVNPRSGGGKAERASLPEQARARGIEPVGLGPGDDLEQLARAAVERGADALAMAGGDGSQAIVAEVASEHGLPYGCIPSGTRNHFALDLGVDRDDVVGALDALVDGGERRVDLGEVNGRVFVNNVSLGVYAKAVQRSGYRDAKLKTLLDTVPDVLGPEGEGPTMRWTGPGGREHSEVVAILVSNNRYRLGRPLGSGTRPRIDDGLLGIAVLGTPGGGGPAAAAPQRPWRDWSAPEFVVDADGPVPAGIDGEAMIMDPPLRFRIRPGVLRVRVSRSHPGASPSARIPEGTLAGVAALGRIAVGRDPSAGQMA